ncbi:MAG: heavy metal translocating P-type ATPase [Candidatus Doudnabacteria bacterium]|nr:heavy metal translocating P-type ATPase [Candidatus Doudnabacteria bacterium]
MKKIDFKTFIIPIFTLTGLVLGLGLHFFGIGHEGYDKEVWLVTLVIGALPAVWRMLKDLRRGHFGVDIIAITAIITSLLFGQYLAGTVIVLMLSGGEALEDFALRRARRELTQLLSRAPSVAHLRTGQGLSDVPAVHIKSGDIFVVKPGEVVPADGLVVEGSSDVDEAAITGEPLPVQKVAGSQIYSGSINRDGALEIKALRPARESTYENIIKLVKEASESRAPVVRLADRYSVWFTAITFVLAGGAWLISHDPIRLLAVLVVATPCPLILATPIAIMSGVSRSASRGIIVKSGGALEKLAEVKAFIFDKTGTLTLGAPAVVGAEAGEYAMKHDIIKISASLDQLSAHVLATSLTEYATKNLNLILDYPENFQEVFGEGVRGKIKGYEYLFGKLSFLQSEGVDVPHDEIQKHAELQNQGKIAVYLAEGKRLLGFVVFADIIRPEIKTLFHQMKREGMEKIVMLTGDKKKVAEIIGKQLGLTDIHAECLPQDKVTEVREHKKEFGSVAMVGDGINDAPALATADVGIALGGHGSTVSSESGDIVITVNNLTRVGQALTIAKETIKIAKQSIFIGIGLSIVLMVIAALGYIIPVYGALLQELLDVAVILNALRVNFIKI